MRTRAIASCALVAALTALSAACVTYRGPRGVESAIEDQMGVELEREFGVKLGWTTTRVAASFVGHDDPDDPIDIKDLTGLGVAVFNVPDGAKVKHRLDPHRLGLRGFELVLEVRDGTDQVLLLAKPHGDTIHEMVFVSVDGEEVVLARLRGRLDRLIEKLMKAAEEGGAKGAREAVPMG